MAMALRKNSPFTRFLKAGINKMKENGQLDYYKNSHWIKNSFCEVPRDKGDPLGFFKLFTIFLILFVGVASSLIVMLFEFCVPKSKEEMLPASKKIDLTRSQIGKRILNYCRMIISQPAPEEEFFHLITELEKCVDLLNKAK